MKRKLQAAAMAAGAFWSASSSGLSGFTYNREGNIRYLVTVMKDSLDQNVPLEGLKTCFNEFTFDFGSGTIIKFIMCMVLSAFAVYGMPKICSGLIGGIMKLLKAVKTHVKMPELKLNDIFEKLENVTDDLKKYASLVNYHIIPEESEPKMVGFGFTEDSKTYSSGIAVDTPVKEIHYLPAVSEDGDEVEREIGVKIISTAKRTYIAKVRGTLIDQHGIRCRKIPLSSQEQRIRIDGISFNVSLI